MYYSKRRFNELCSDWLEVNNRLNQLKEDKAAIEKELLAYYSKLEKNDKNQVYTNEYLFKPTFYTNQERFNEKEFKQDHIDLYEEYKRPISDYTVFKKTSFKKVVK